MAKTEEQKAAEKAAKEAEKRTALVADLAALNITTTGGTPTITPLTGDETTEQLADILKQAKADEKAAEKAAADASKVSTDPVTVKYRDHKGEPTERTFSKEVHGENFAKLADEFKVTNANSIIS